MVNYKKIELVPGLYFVATPIGNARDITLRALDVLYCADVLAAEDTRILRRLMKIHSIPLFGRPLVSYHDHSPEKIRKKLMVYIQEGKSVAYTSDAGTPLIADPGYRLSKHVIEEGHLISAAPGPTAFLAALTLAGLATESFLFDGFLPSRRSARRARLQKLSETESTLIFYESPKRLAAMLIDACEVLGEKRKAAYCRELTKKFEEVKRGTLSELRCLAELKQNKGECIVLIDRAVQTEFNNEAIDLAIKDALKAMSLRDASEAISEAFGLPRRKIYNRALQVVNNNNNNNKGR